MKILFKNKIKLSLVNMSKIILLIIYYLIRKNDGSEMKRLASKLQKNEEIINNY
jgi:hypothetical protein